MTEEITQEQETNNAIPIDVNKITYAILKTQESVSVHKDLILNPVPENIGIEIKYDNETELFTFLLKKEQVDGDQPAAN